MKKVRKNGWTPYEERVLRSHVKKCPENLMYCFFLASKEIDRSRDAIRVHYYKHIKNQKKGVLFTLFSKFKNLFNVKIQKKDYGK